MAGSQSALPNDVIAPRKKNTGSVNSVWSGGAGNPTAKLPTAACAHQSPPIDFTTPG